MELDVDLSSLAINERKRRRRSGRFKPMPSLQSYDCCEDDTDDNNDQQKQQAESESDPSLSSPTPPDIIATPTSVDSTSTAAVTSHVADAQSPDSPERKHIRRSTRVKTQLQVQQENSEKRRVLTKPMKLSENSSFTQIQKYYLDRTVKHLRTTLETIHEEPKGDSQEIIYMSSRKFKRAINFGESCSKNGNKVKKRRMKAKGVSADKRVRNKKVTLDFLMKKLADLDED